MNLRSFILDVLFLSTSTFLGLSHLIISYKTGTENSKIYWVKDYDIRAEMEVILATKLFTTLYA